MKKGLTTNALKLIALGAMIIDHAGSYFFNNNIFLRILGRFSFPIFAYFIAEGLYYTKNKKKYFISLLIASAVSQIPYMLMFKTFELNTLFTYVFSILLIYFIKNLKSEDGKVYFENIILLFLFNIIVILFSLYGLISYGYLGVLVSVVFYFLRGKPVRFFVFAILNTLISLKSILFLPTAMISYVQLFALLSIPVLLLYNGRKGSLNIKNLFYIVYPLHMLLFYFIKILFL